MKKHILVAFLLIVHSSARSQKIVFIEPLIITKTEFTHTEFGYKPITTPYFIFKPQRVNPEIPNLEIGIGAGIKFEKIRSAFKLVYNSEEGVGGYAFKAQYFVINPDGLDSINHSIEGIIEKSGVTVLRKIQLNFAYSLLRPKQFFTFKNRLLSIELNFAINSFIYTNEDTIKPSGWSDFSSSRISTNEIIHVYSNSLIFPRHYSFFKEIKPSIGICFRISKTNGRELFNLQFEYRIPNSKKNIYGETHLNFDVLNNNQEVVKHYQYILDSRENAFYIKLSRKFDLNPIWDKKYRKIDF